MQTPNIKRVEVRGPWEFLFCVAWLPHSSRANTRSCHPEGRLCPRDLLLNSSAVPANHPSSLPRRTHCTLRFCRILTHESIALVGHAEAAIGAHRHLQIVPVIGFIDVPQKLLRRIVLRALCRRAMQMPEIH